MLAATPVSLHVAPGMTLFQFRNAASRVSGGTAAATRSRTAAARLPRSAGVVAVPRCSSNTPHNSLFGVAAACGAIPLGCSIILCSLILERTVREPFADCSRTVRAFVPRTVPALLGDSTVLDVPETARLVRIRSRASNCLPMNRPAYSSQSLIIFPSVNHPTCRSFSTKLAAFRGGTWHARASSTSLNAPRSPSCAYRAAYHHKRCRMPSTSFSDSPMASESRRTLGCSASSTYDGIQVTVVRSACRAPIRTENRQGRGYRPVRPSWQVV